MTRQFTPFVLTLIVMAAPPVFAQAPAPAAPPLTLHEAVTQTLQNNASLRAARAGSDAALASADAARASWFPRVSFTESWQRGDQPVFVFSTLLASRRFAADNFAIDRLNHPDPIGYFHGTVGVEQLLFDGGARAAAIDTARAQQSVADFSARETAIALATTVTESYGRLLTLQAQRNAASAALDTAREDHTRASQRRDAGMATEADVLALAVHVADLEQRAIQADGDAAAVRASLNRLMGAPIDRAFGAVEPDTPADVAAPSIDSLVAEAVKNRPELQRAAAAERIAENATRAARSALVPQVGAQAAFDMSGSRFNDRASSWLVGGELRWSISSGGAERAQMRAAAASAAKARAEADDVRAQVQVDVVSALQQIASARARRAVGRAAVDQARESQRIIRDRFDAGLAPVNDVLRAASAVLDADTQRVSALVDEVTGLARLNRAVGRMP